MTRARAPWPAYACLAVGMAVVGAYVGFSKVILQTLPVFLLALIRFALAAAMMAPFTWPRGALALLKQHWPTIVMQSFFGNFLFSICMLSGVKRTSAASAGVIMSMLPAVVALFSWWMLTERPSSRSVIAIALAVVGIAFLELSTPSGQTATGTTGNVLMVGALACEALYVVLGKRLTSANLGAMQISAWINAVGLLLMLPFGLWQARGFAFGAVRESVWVLVLLYAFAASVASTWLWLTGLRHVPASKAGVFTVALPISSALVGLVFLNEQLTIAHVVAFFCAVTGIFLVTTPLTFRRSAH